MAVTLPSLSTPAVDGQGFFTTAWVGFLSRLSGGSPAAIQGVTLDPSPFSYTAPGEGSLSIVGGTVGAVMLTRSRTAITMPTSGLIPVSQGDVLAITYTVAPTIFFIPRTA